VLRVDERGDTAGCLGIGHRVQRDRGLTRGLRTIDLDDAPPREPTDPERDIEGERAGRDHLDRRAGVVTQTHDRALTEGLVDLRERQVQRLLAVLPRRRCGGLARSCPGLACHLLLSVRARPPASAVGPWWSATPRTLRPGYDINGRTDARPFLGVEEPTPCGGAPRGHRHPV